MSISIIRRFRWLAVVLALLLVAFYSGIKFQSKTHLQNSQIASNLEQDEALEFFKEAGGFVLPARLFVIAGKPINIFLRSIVPVKDFEVFRYSIECKCNFVSLQRRSILIDSDSSVRGKFPLKITASTLEGQVIQERSIELILLGSDAGTGKKFKMLMIGDSLGHQSRFPNEFAKLLQKKGNPEVEFIGSYRPPGAIIPHEHYGGWQFKYFLTAYKVDPKSYWRDRSPFVFDDGAGNPRFDPARYFRETVGGAEPRNIHIQLGINDAFALDPQSPDLSSQMDEILRNADVLIAGLRKALPKSIISVGSVIPANFSDRSFIESYKGYPIYQNEWRWRRLQMRLARKMIDHFEGTAKDNILFVPTHALIDSVDGYNAHVWVPDGVDYTLTNAVHPSKIGDQQVAGAIYAVFKAELVGLTDQK